MKKDAHYYGVLGFSRALGFKKEAAHIIAYASQFVDDAKVNHLVLEDKPQEIEFEMVAEEPSFLNMATCHSYFQLDTFNYNAMINNTTAFHFVPGAEGDNFAKKMRCKEESPIILEILEEALKDDDLVKLGMVLHAYADTFAHQGFSGLLSKVNDIKNLREENIVEDENEEINLMSMVEEAHKFVAETRILEDAFETCSDKAIPAYGHGQVLTYPDAPYLKWEYEYDCSDQFGREFKKVEIDNKERFKRAFEKIKEHLVTFLENNPQYKDEEMNIEDDQFLFETLVTEDTLDNRIETWQQVLKRKGLFSIEDMDILEYDEGLWLEEAFSNYDPDEFKARKVEDVELAADFPESKWYQYYQAVSWYKDKFHQSAVENGLAIQI